MSGVEDPTGTGGGSGGDSASGPHGDAHGDHDGHGHEGHDHPAHGPDPLGGVDAAELHVTVDELTAVLHEYIETAVGVRAEFGAHEADEDPRILAIEARVSGLNAALYDLVHERLGLHSDLTGMTWDDTDEDESGADAPHEVEEVETFHLGFVVGPQAGTSDLSMDSVLGMVDDAGEQIARRLMESGFEVSEWGASRGAPVLFDDHEDDDE
ncbi:hypothetical protein [Cellulomonas sp. NS3]|uniref:hypothetical protein n=1 Tax=Cellulomonas sp. NS3 TaxID=2973977 RepID=UPI002161C29F|nr:hypothetical protein [Cellulomonas sp. NS3]